MLCSFHSKTAQLASGPETIYHNARIATLDGSSATAEALAIDGGRFLAVGRNQDILALAGAATRIIDLGGKRVIPGLIEAHAHPEEASISELEDEIPDVRSLGELLDWVRRQAAVRPKGSWIIHPKMFPTRLVEMRQPTLSELDAAAPDHPVFLDGTYGGAVNSAAMRASGITSETSHSGILKDDSGLPSGLIQRAAFRLLNRPKRREPALVERASALAALFDRYHAVGFTSVTSGAAGPDEIALYQYMRRRDLLNMRVFLHIYIDSAKEHRSLHAIRKELAALGYSTGFGDEWLRIGALKTILDGGILTGTAYLREPWGGRAREIYGIEDPEYRGNLFFETRDLIHLVQAGAERGWKVSAHATGGGAVDQLLEACESVNELTPVAPLRFSVIHGNFFTPGCIERMKRLGIIADVQAAWFYKDADAMLKVLGPERIRWFNAYRSLMEAGVVVSAGSDHMVKLDATTSINPYSPWLAMWSMVTRKTERGSVIVPEEALSREQALRCYSINNAFSSFEENLKGSVEPGKLADLVVLDRDYFTCPVDEIKEIRSVLTVVGGEEVYSAGVSRIGEKQRSLRQQEGSLRR
jgi:predicted amidohydrolase YtcJ